LIPGVGGGKGNRRNKEKEGRRQTLEISTRVFIAARPKKEEGEEKGPASLLISGERRDRKRKEEGGG